jgi:GH24 family phage-related lysozyme (muramidase)
MKPTDKCFDFIMEHTPFIPSAVKHPSGCVVYGYGHEDWNTDEGYKIDKPHALEVLKLDLLDISNSIQYFMEEVLEKPEKVVMSHSRFDSLVSFIHNVYYGKRIRVKYYDILNYYDAKGVSMGIEMLRHSYYLASGYVSTHGEFSNELINRRLGEIRMYYST